MVLRRPPPPPPPADLDARVATAAARLLMLDYDGTLAPFHTDPDRAEPYPGVRELLARILAARRTRLVIVSGRAVESLPALLGLRPLPELWGTHGWERLRPGRRPERIPLSVALTGLLSRALAAIEAQGLGGRCEVKPAALAVHWRGLSAAEARSVEERARAAWEPLLAGGEMSLREFDGGLELRPGGRGKGAVVQTLLRESPAGVFAAYLGDDFTDEDAFRALGDQGLSVLVRPEPRSTAARAWIRPPEELLDFLRTWAEAEAH